MQQALIRLAVLVVLLLNQTLVLFGWNPLPFSEEQVYMGISAVATVIGAIWTWYKNNNVTKEAEEAQIYLNKLKGKVNK